MDELIEVNERVRRPVRDLADPDSLGRDVLKVLVDKIPPAKIADTIVGLLRATRTTKHGEVADTRSQEAGVKLWLAYCVGLPVQRQEIRTETVNNDSEVMLRLLASPAMRAALRQALDAAEKNPPVEQ